MTKLHNPEQLSATLAQYRPRKLWVRRFLNRSAVALVLRPNGAAGPEALMIARAQRSGDPWSGHMAFPGGRLEKSDRHTMDAARRELAEEVGLSAPDAITPIGRLSDLLTHGHHPWRPMVVSAFVFRADQPLELTPNHEVADILWVPLPFLAAAEQRDTMVWQLRQMRLRLPCYHYGGQRIWGLSLALLDELIALLYGCSFPDRSGRIMLRGILSHLLRSQRSRRHRRQQPRPEEAPEESAKPSS